VIKFTAGKRLVAIGRMLCASDELVSWESKKKTVRILRVFND
jgi:hypothetical protein